MSGDLDDFFAKKDKNRKKKTKGISSEDFVQKYEYKCRENEPNNKENQSNHLLSNLESFVQDDGEWNDFEDENKDYSGLKIQALTIDDDEQREKEEEDIKKEQLDTPWGRKDDTKDGDDKNPDNDDSDVEKADDKDDDDDDNDNDDPDQKQISPSNEMEKPAEESAISEDGGLDLSKITAALFKSKLNRQIQTNKKSDKQAPKIDDAVEFPDLGATDEAIADAKTFQPVRSGLISSSLASRLGPAPPLPGQQNRHHQNDSTISTDNRYSALRNKGGW